MIEVKRQSKAKRTKSSNTSKFIMRELASCSDEYSDAAATIASPNKVQEQSFIACVAQLRKRSRRHGVLHGSTGQGGLHFFFIFY